MKLFNLTLQASTSISKVISGSFSAADQEEIILVKTKSIELYTISPLYLSNYSGKNYNLFPATNYSPLLSMLSLSDLQGYNADNLVW